MRQLKGRCMREMKRNSWNENSNAYSGTYRLEIEWNAWLKENEINGASIMKIQLVKIYSVKERKISERVDINWQIDLSKKFEMKN